MENHTYLKSFSIIHRFSIMYHVRELKKFKISGHQMGYIMCVCKKPGISQEGVSAFLRLNKGAVAKGVRPLIQEGYIKRVQNQNDKRAYQLYPTDKAQVLFAEAEKTMENFDQVLTQGMKEDEKEMFKKLLSKACDNVMEAVGADQHELLEQTGPPSEICLRRSGGNRRNHHR